MLITERVDRAARSIRLGGLVAIPTETVYGLAADAENLDAVARIFEVKGRPTSHPLIVHIAGSDALGAWAASVPDDAALLAGTCWPGPLTLLLPRSKRVSDAITGGRDIVGVRVPAHPLTLELLDELGGGLAAPSANRFGRVSPTTAHHVAADLADHLDPKRDLILDGGSCPVGVESTIIDCSVDPPQILRPGGIPTDDIEQLLDGRLDQGSGPARASGMLRSHYSPDCLVVLADDDRHAEELADEARNDGAVVSVIDRTDDLVTAARELYTDLRRADDDGVDVLVAVMPPAEGLGHAIRDRLMKAAAEHCRDRPSRDG